MFNRSVATAEVPTVSMDHYHSHVIPIEIAMLGGIPCFQQSKGL